MVLCRDLRPQQNLLNPNFESYKLSLTKLPIYVVELPSNASTNGSLDDVFSYQKVRSITLHNHLTCDRFNDDNFYYVDVQGNVMVAHVEMEACTAEPTEVTKLDTGFVTSSSAFPSRVSFASESKAVIVDGADTLYVFETGDRKQIDTKWNCVYKDTNKKMWQECELLTSKHITNGEKITEAIHIIFSRFEQNEDDKNATVITQWITLKPTDNKSFEMTESRNFTSKSIPFYANLSEDGNQLFIGCVDEVVFTPDWSQQLDEDVVTGDKNGEKTEEKCAYTCTQNLEEIVVKFELPENTDKKNVVYSLSMTKLSLGLRNEDGTIKDLLSGDLHSQADAELSTWTIADGVLEVTIHKKNTHKTWLCVVDGDERGHFHTDPAQARIISEQLEKYTAENVATDDKHPTSIDQSEDCDNFVEPAAALLCFNDREFTHRADLSTNHWLFNSVYEGEYCPVFRHDVDGLVWSCTGNSQSPWRHVGTFNALGFVQASKKNVKFTSCSSSGSYVAMCENQHRVFVYHQPTALCSSLRNRQTGQEILHIAKQQVVTLPTDALIIGFQATDQRMIVLTERKLFIIKSTNLIFTAISS